MEYRELGATGEKVSAIGVGCWAAGGTQWGGTDDVKSSEAFLRALDLGVNFFDTAPVYGFGHSESIVGETIGPRRDEVFLATKFGLRWHGAAIDEVYNELRPDSILAECEESLQRLRTDRIDLYQAHWPLQEGRMTQTVAEDMMATLEKLREQGKVRHFGVSNFSVEQMQMCGGSGHLASLQPPLSLLRPGASREIIPFCKDKRIGVVCYSPLFRGLLTGKYAGAEEFGEGDSRGEHPDYSGENFQAICDRVARLRAYAERHETSVTAVSLNWVLGEPGVTAALAGTREAAQIAEAAEAAGWSLDALERAEITDLFADLAKIT